MEGFIFPLTFLFIEFYFHILILLPYSTQMFIFSWYSFRILCTHLKNPREFLNMSILVNSLSWISCKSLWVVIIMWFVIWELHLVFSVYAVSIFILLFSLLEFCLKLSDTLGFYKPLFWFYVIWLFSVLLKP